MWYDMVWYGDMEWWYGWYEMVLYVSEFSFSDDKFLTSWITVNDGEGTILSSIDITFIHTNTHVEQIKWKADCMYCMYCMYVCIYERSPVPYQYLYIS